MQTIAKEYLEREVKIVTDASGLKPFMKVCQDRGGRYVHGAGTDRYYQHPKFDVPVIRHRFSDSFNELTVKEQVDGVLVRKEVNLRLPDGVGDEVGALLAFQGYEVALEISKISHIFYFPYAVLSYYTVMTPAGELLHVKDEVPARFIEVELNEDINWKAEFGKYRITRKGLYVPDWEHPMPSYSTAETAEEFCKSILEDWIYVLFDNQVPCLSQPLDHSLWDMFGEKGGSNISEI